MEIKQSINLIALKRVFWTTPLLTGLSIGVCVSGVNAATIALSSVEVEVNPINIPAFTWGVDTQAHTWGTVLSQGQVTAMASAGALGINTDQGGLSFNQTDNITTGSGSHYSGIAQSAARILGIFSVFKDQTFTFNFRTVFNLLTWSDHPSKENAYSQSKIDLKLVNITTGLLLDSFSLVGSVGTQGQMSYEFNPFLYSQFSPPIVLYSFDNNQQNLGVSFEGSYAKIWDENSEIALIEDQQSLAAVTSVPEPSTLLGGAIFIGFLRLFRRIKRS